MSLNEPSLDAVIGSSNALIKRLEVSVRLDETFRDQTLDGNQSNALALAATAATLLKAQTTKLSLLALNEPYTPSEMSKLIRSLTTQCFPALVAAAQLAVPEAYSSFLHHLLRGRIGNLLLLLPTFFDQLPRTAAAAKEAVSRQDTLQHTGKIWESCDFLVELSKPEVGLVETAATEMTKWRDLVKDAASELEQWQQDGAEVLGDDLSVGSDGTDAVAEKLQATKLAPTTSEDILDRNETRDEPARLNMIADVIKTIGLIKMLYPPLTRRRIKRFPQIAGNTKYEKFPTQAQVQILDHIIGFGQRATEATDLTAESLYMGDEASAKEELITLRTIARDCLSHVERAWDGTDDELTGWSKQWLAKLDEIGV